MYIEMMVGIMGAFISFTAAILIRVLGNSAPIRRMLLMLPGRPATKQPYSERLAGLTASLVNASREVDKILSELATVSKDRTEAVRQLETDLVVMEGREKQLKERIETLDKTPLVVAEHFAKLVTPGEKRSAKRDYLLFGAGVIVSTVISLAIQLLIK